MLTPLAFPPVQQKIMTKEDHDALHSTLLDSTTEHPHAVAFHPVYEVCSKSLSISPEQLCWFLTISYAFLLLCVQIGPRQPIFGNCWAD
jgi:hypothetical protein